MVDSFISLLPHQHPSSNSAGGDFPFTKNLRTNSSSKVVNATLKTQPNRTQEDAKGNFDIPANTSFYLVRFVTSSLYIQHVLQATATILPSIAAR